MIRRPNACFFLIAYDPTFLDPAPPLATRQTGEDVIDSSRGLELRPRIGIPIRPGDSPTGFSGKRRIADDFPGIEKGHALTRHGMSAGHETNLVRIRLGIEIADDDRRESVLGPTLPDSLGQEFNLFLPNVAVIELPMKMGTGESDWTVWTVDRHRECGTRLPISSIGQLDLFAIENRPAARDRVSKLKMLPIRQGHGRSVVKVVVEIPALSAQDLSSLIDSVPYQDLLEPDQIGIQAINPSAKKHQAIRPGLLVMPEIQRKHLQCHGENLAVRRSLNMIEKAKIQRILCPLRTLAGVSTIR